MSLCACSHIIKSGISQWYYISSAFLQQNLALILHFKCFFTEKFGIFLA